MDQREVITRLEPKRDTAGARPPEASMRASRMLPWARVAAFATVGIFFILAIGALYFARSILMPVLSAIIIGITLSPIAAFVERYRVPAPVTATVLAILILAALFTIASLFAATASDWFAHASEIGEAIRNKLRVLDPALAALHRLQDAVKDAAGASGPTVALEMSPATLLQTILVVITPALTELLLFFATLLFFLAGHGQLRQQFVTKFGERAARLRVLRIWNDLEENLIGYLGTVTLINVGVGVATAVIAYLVGYPQPLTWGVLAFVLNYVPYVGPAIVVLLLFAVGLVALPTLGQAALAPLLFVALTTIEGHVVTPSIIGRRLVLHPLLVFLALAFWTWLWGPLGAFLAMPFLIAALVALEHVFPRKEAPLPG